MAVRGERAVLGQPEQSVRSGPTRAAALTGAISGTVLLAVSFLPWLHYGYSDGGSVNAWTDSSTSFDTVGGAGYTIGAVMAGFVAAVCATALVRGLFVSEMPEPEPWAHGWAGVVLIVGGAFVFVLSFMRLGVVLDSGYDSYLAPGVGMYIGWLAALGLVVGGGLEIRDARRLRAKRRARPFIGVAGAVFTVMSSAGLFVASFFPWWEGGPPSATTTARGRVPSASTRVWQS
ncbi:MAG: hypothetical protein M5U31_15180 [Acidimicrobiia bacterium]|nr:hypothetical protein [Acidimicrobiia bacterium]